MKFLKFYLVALVLFAAGCSSAKLAPSGPTSPSAPADTTNTAVVTPTNGSSVGSPFTLDATATACSSQTVVSMGYSLDSAAASPVDGTALNLQVTAAAGSHTLHVDTWGSDGSTCDTNVAITVTAAAPPPPAPPTPTPPAPTTNEPTAPANAIVLSSVQNLAWNTEHDSASGDGTTTGATSLVTSPSKSGSARQFETSYTDASGERYEVSFASDPTAANFLYDAWVYVASPSNGIANLEFDMNQVTANGQTVIYGFQCDGYSGTWDYTENAGTPAATVDHWLHSTASCNPGDWTTDTWHHVQVTYMRDDAGNVTYQSVWFDGAEQDVNATVPSSFALGWGSVLLTNFQVDGIGAAGMSTVYIDDLTISRW